MERIGGGAGIVGDDMVAGLIAGIIVAAVFDRRIGLTMFTSALLRLAEVS